MRRLASLLAFSLLSAPVAARADSLTDEIGMGTTQTTPQNPRSGNFSNNLAASFDLGEQWVLNTGLGLTFEGATRSPGSPFRGTASSIASLSAGLDFSATDSLSLGLSLDVSPSSKQDTGTSLNFVENGSTTNANALLQSSAANSAVAADLTYDSGGDSAFEWGFSLGATGSHYSTDQRIIAIQRGDGSVVGANAVLNYCAANPSKCSPALVQALRAQPAQLDSLKLSAGGTITIFQDTDLGVGFDTYSYSQDPTTAGYFSVGSAGRSTISGGNGIAIAPLKYAVHPEIDQRFGDFSVRLSATAGRYVDGGGQNTRSLGARLQYKFTKEFRLWVSATGQKDIAQDGSASNSGTFTLGGGYRF